MPVERDPRNDPRPGDVLRNPAGTCFHVERIEWGTVLYLQNGHSPLLEHSLNDWRRDAAHDEVVTRG